LQTVDSPLNRSNPQGKKQTVQVRVARSTFVSHQQSPHLGQRGSLHRVQKL
jgi:hypothetical protein